MKFRVEHDGRLAALFSSRFGSSAKRKVTGVVLAFGMALLSLGVLPASPAAAYGEGAWGYFDPMGGTGCTCGGEYFGVQHFNHVVSPATDPSIPGMVMTGWYTAPTGPALKWDFSPSSRMSGGGQTFTLYARYVPAKLGSPLPASDTHTVTFDSTDGAAIDSVTITDTVAVPAPDAPAKAGSTFDGWFTAATGGQRFAFATPISSNQTLFAHWTTTAVVVGHTVTFGDGYGHTTAVVTIHGGSLVAAPAAPFRAGHVFAGWFTAPTGGHKFGFSTTPVNSDTVLYAHWVLTAGTVNGDDVPAPQPPTVAAQTLPDTGGDVPVGLVAAGVLLVLLGVGLIRRSRRRA